ncbi:MAG: GTPase HflX [Acidimicrobiia bacterium]|nr:GTPase HflX [Acidimicrobiia bacterium]MYC58176.1 GTPase HflX [Acidimicrobiia bacterium]MYG94337.1 GTPase HflX [Acidimicrobiia bacterium]MYI30608.1 GTPase HflX [Acidimicrobiia bacterium]
MAEHPSHRGGFGTHGGESGAFIERAFREKIVLVGVTLAGANVARTEADLDELAQLIATAGADARGRIVQRRKAPDPATYVGRGKVGEILELCENLDADTVVFDDELTPAQQFNLEKLLGRTAIDRTAVILDIFAQNANSQEGQAQVELAQHRYRLPRLRRVGRFSQQAGGIGTRGPGETQLEVDRRRIQRRIHKLEAQLRSIAKNRNVQSLSRRRSAHSNVTIVGYTNAGKSRLLNQLSNSSVLVQDRLFATLDATTRRLDLSGGERVLLTDTVGFIRKLPHQLVDAFHTTLDVVTEADLLLHVVDAASVEPDVQVAAVRKVLHEIGAAAVPELLVYNKCDLLEASAISPGAGKTALAVSAATGEGIDKLLAAMADELRSDAQIVEFLVPFARGEVLAAVQRSGQVLRADNEASGYRIQARMDRVSAARLAEWVVA